MQQVFRNTLAEGTFPSNGFQWHKSEWERRHGENTAMNRSLDTSLLIWPIQITLLTVADKTLGLIIPTQEDCGLLPFLRLVCTDTE